MTKTQIEKRQAMANLKFEVALKIKALLDEARKTYGSQAWDDDDMDASISELVFEE